MAINDSIYSSASDEKGRYAPSGLLMFKIARVLEMKVDELFELAEE